MASRDGSSSPMSGEPSDSAGDQAGEDQTSASARASGRQKSKRQLVVRNGETGLMVGKEFVLYANFTISVSAQASTPPGFKPYTSGCVFDVVSSDGDSRKCFVGCHEYQTLKSFVIAAERSHEYLGYAKANDQLWSQYVFNMAQEYVKGGDVKRLTLVTCIGKQPTCSTTWVMGPDVQIDSDGKLIPREHQAFFWCGDLLQFSAPRILVPLEVNPLKDLIFWQKQCLRNNFMSSFLGLAGGVLVFHFQTIHDQQDECPIILLYSKSSGTGKSTTLKNIMAIFGVEQIYSPKTTESAIMEQAANTTIPLGFDDITSAKKLEEMAVAFYNGFTKRTSAKGDLRPRTGLIITSNCPFSDNQRNVQRIVHVPFYPALESPSVVNQLESEERMLQAREIASKAIGYIIAMQRALKSSTTKDYIGKTLLPYIGKLMPDVHPRTRKCYGMVLLVARLLCEVAPDVVTFADVMEFFKSSWAPAIELLHRKKGGIIKDFLVQVLEAVKELPTHEVIQMVLSKASSRDSNIKMVALYMPGLSPHLPGMEVSRINKEVIEMGGRTNASYRFLKPGCTDTRCTSANSRVCKGVLKIPRTRDLPPRILCELDSVCYPGEEIDATVSEIAELEESLETESLENVLNGAIVTIDPQLHNIPTSSAESSESEEDDDYSSASQNMEALLHQKQANGDDYSPLIRTGSRTPPDQLPSPAQTIPSFFQTGSLETPEQLPAQTSPSLRQTGSLETPEQLPAQTSPSLRQTGSLEAPDQLPAQTSPSLRQAGSLETPEQLPAQTSPSLLQSPSQELMMQRNAAMDLLKVVPAVKPKKKTKAAAAAPQASKDVCPKEHCKRKGKKLAMVCCNNCSQWCHCICMGLTKWKADKLPSWNCPMCQT